MSGFFANFTATSIDGNPPSIFEIVAQEGLASSLRPALHHILRVLAQNKPETFGFVYQWKEEVYYFIKLIADNHYLKKYDGSFAENFYGIKRIPMQGEKLSKKHRMLSLLCLILIPYIKQKCDSFYEVERDAYLENPCPATTFKNKLIRCFLSIYPVIHMGISAISYTNLLAYVLGKLPYHSPLLPISRINLQLQGTQDLEEETIKPLLFKGKSLFVKCYLAVKYLLRLFSSMTSHIMSAAMFFVQFIDWWYTSDLHTITTAGKCIPAPNFTIKNTFAQMPSVCPLCQKLRTNHTALAVSGYVFCYPCIHEYIQQNRRCPITNYPASTDHLIRIIQD